MSPDSRQHFAALVGLTRTSPDGLLIYNCAYCRREIPDAGGALVAQSGQPWRAWCYNHEPPHAGQWSIPVETVRTAEAVLIQMAGWVEVSWTPDFTPWVVAVARALRNQHLADLERLREEEAHQNNGPATSATEPGQP